MSVKDEIYANNVIDFVERAIGIVQGMPKSRENSIVITKLEEAILWFQKGQEPK